jgi:hypothetical protein
VVFGISFGRIAQILKITGENFSKQAKSSTFCVFVVMERIYAKTSDDPAVLGQDQLVRKLSQLSLRLI